VVGVVREPLLRRDVIARRARELAATGTPYWLVTSDRGLRERAGGDAARVVGGGAFAGEVLSSKSR
jgi:hypothetical protein